MPRSRRNNEITAKQVYELFQAANAAIYLGCSLNQFLTVNCTRAGFARLGVHKFITAYMKSAGNWMYANGTKWAWVWVLENPPGGPLNWHVLLHVPEDRVELFHDLSNRWFEKAGARLDRNVLDWKQIGRVSRDDNPIRYVAGLKGVLCYMMKGAEKEVCSKLWIERKNQGEIIGKRTAVAEALGPTARARDLQPIRAVFRYPSGPVEIIRQRTFLLMEEGDPRPSRWDPD